jgi:superoxide dismutase, Fe-Mn family
MVRGTLSRILKEAGRESERAFREADAPRTAARPASATITRRRLIGTALAAGSLAAIGHTRPALSQASGPFSLPPLPYPEEALAPVISTTTIGFHYGKHHRAYVDNLNKAVAGTELAGKSLDDIVKATAGDPARVGVFNNAAQDWNHTFYWNSMRPNGGGVPTGTIADHIKDSFGDYAKFRLEFATAAVTQFGSGWAWLVQDQDKKLKVVKSANADTPMAQGITCLLTCDVWEHAYYLDYQNRRADYVNAWLDNLVNWDFAARQIAA